MHTDKTIAIVAALALAYGLGVGTMHGKRVSNAAADCGAIGQPIDGVFCAGVELAMIGIESQRAALALASSGTSALIQAPVNAQADALTAFERAYLNARGR
jgi:hypothetical protein